MISYTIIAAVVCAAPLTLALPQVTDATSSNPTVFTPWSSDPACAVGPTACKTDCTKAVDTLCRKDLGTANIKETVGECTAWYMYEIGNTLPTFDQCYSAFAYINDKGKFGANDCGGTFGGALGWDKNGNRTNDPAFAIYPKSGNGNCFKKDGDMSPPLPQDTLPDGTKLPIDKCPTATSRRGLLRRDGEGECVVEDLVWNAGCGAVCIGWITASAWWTGPVVAVGWLACLGGCDAVGFKLVDNCFKGKGIDPDLKPRAAAAADPPAVCKNTGDVAFECSAIRNLLLGFHGCEGSSTADRTSGGSAGGSAGVINT
ncbi:MAG: hypothetical protein LQ350_008491 [Teloschistes chrysophthalmus]|nr:MAG: hypothetical protein LQ350_008491 [Niorma chrysophthalma]